MESIDDLVYGHALAKKALTALLKRSKQRYYDKCVMGGKVFREPLKILLIGPSGTGKTHLIQSFSQLYEFPLISLDATQLTPSGNADGINLKQLKAIINKKVEECLDQPGYYSREGVLNQLVIFVDEFDKLGTSFDSSGNWNKHVQSNFLTIIDNKEEFSGISWVFVGAFSTLFEYKCAKKIIGFSSDVSEEKNIEISDKDILKAGIIPEMLGRITLIVQLDTLTKEDFKNILINRLLPKYTLKLTAAETDAIVTKAIQSEQGIRSMTRQLEILSIEAEYENENMNLYLPLRQ